MADFFDDEDIQTEDSFFDTEDINEDIEVSQSEAALRGAAQGLSFDFADELQAGAEGLYGDLESLVTGEQLGEPVTFDEEGRAIVPESDGEGYNKRLKEIRDRYNASKEQHPVTYHGASLVGGMAPALLTGGASAAGNVGKALASGGKGLLGASKEAAKLGAKYGAVSGAGMSEADSPQGVLADAAVGGVIGAGTGLLTPVAVKGLKAGANKTREGIGELIDMVPGIGAAKAGFKAGQKGITTSDEGITTAALEWAEKAHKKIVSVMSKNGVDKKQALKIADEAGERINAGEDIDEVLEALASEGALGMDIKAKQKFYDALADLKKGAAKLKRTKKLEERAAVAAAKEEQKYGSEVVRTSEVDKSVEDFIPLPESGGKVEGIRSKYKARNPLDPDASPMEYETAIFKAVEEKPIKQLELDLENLTPTEAQKVLTTINDNLVGDMNAKAANEMERKARLLAKKLSEKVTKAIDSQDANKTMSKIFTGTEKLGMKNVGGNQRAMEDQVDALAKKVRSTGPSADIDKRRGFDKLLEASDELAGVVDEGKFISELAAQKGMDSSGSLSTRNIIKDVAIGGANFAGKASHTVSKLAKPVTGTVSKVANGVMGMTDDGLNAAAVKMVESNQPGLQAMGNQLQHAMQQEGPLKNALLWSLSQQPAFRKSVQHKIGAGSEEFNEALGIEASPVDEYLFPTEEQDAAKEEGDFFGEDSISTEDSAPDREPQAVSNIDDGLKHVLGVEAGYQAQRADKGNYLNGKLIGTNRGITPKAYKKYYGKTPSVQDMKRLSEYQALEIYKSDYVNKPKFDLIEDPNLQTNVVDHGINAGTSKAIRTLQKVVGVSQDGHMGPATVKAINNYEGDLNADFSNARREYYSKIKGKKGAKYQKGWQNRVDEIEALTSEPKLEDGGLVAEEMPVDHEGIEAVEKQIKREKKQLGSGASGDQRDSLDALMGRLQALNVDEDTRDVMENAAYDGKLDKLQDMLDRLKH